MRAAIFMAVAAIGAGAAGVLAAPLKITAAGLYGNGPTASADRTLADYATKLIIDGTGVDASWPVYPQDWTPAQFWQNATAAGTMPQVVVEHSPWPQAQVAQFAAENNLLREITPAMVKRYMPNYVARAQKYGRTAEDLLGANRYQGKYLSVPAQFSFSAFPGLLDNPAARQPADEYSALAFRDDVLKMIFPRARSEAELRELLGRNGTLTIDDLLDDIPIKTLDDLYAYLKAVKSLDLMVGDQPLIPAGIIASGESAGGIDESLRTAIGFVGGSPFIMGTPPQFADSVNPALSPEYRQLMQWLNKCYNEGLLDPELFVMTDAQFNARQVNGAYAVINGMGQVAGARAAGKSRNPPYGFRYFPLFYGQLRKNLLSNSILYMDATGSPIAITKSAREADIPRILKWIDWYMSEERDSLAYWGMPSWYRGTGRARRYLPGHTALEDWAVYGISSSRDGSYYGLENAYPAASDPLASARLPLSPMGFFSDAQTYPDAPYYLYPKDVRKLLPSADLWAYSESILKAARFAELSVFTTAADPRTAILALPAVAAWDTARRNDPAYASAIETMITGTQSDFESNYSAFVDLCNRWGSADGSGAGKALQAAVDFWRKYWKDQVQGKLVQKPR